MITEIATAAAWLAAIFWIIGIPITYRFARLAGEDTRRSILWASAWPRSCAVSSPSP